MRIKPLSLDCNWRTLFVLLATGLLLWGGVTVYVGHLMLQSQGESLLSAAALPQGGAFRQSPPHLLRTRVMELNGRVIYSDPPEETGRVLSLSALADAAAGKTSCRLLNIVTVRGATRALEAIGPLSLPGGRKFAVSLVVDSSRFQASLLRMRLVVAAFVLLAMGILYGAVNGIISRVARRLIDRNWKLAGEKVALQDALERVEGTYVSTLQAISAAIDTNDTYANGHAARVAEYAVKIAKGLGFSPRQLEQLRDAALLHDIGRIWIPDHILHKEGPLTQEEMATVKSHPVLGAEILAAIPSLRDKIPAILHHHERYDGKGYPHGLKGWEIPLEARILALADAFDAMTSDRPYRSARLLRDALEEIYEGAGRQFDPKVVEGFMNVLDEITRGAENMLVKGGRFGARLYSMVGNC